MNESEKTAEKTAIAAHLYITLRRKLNRVIDVEWLVRNEDYAREVIGMARQPGLEEVAHYADRMEELIFGKILRQRPVEPKPQAIPKIVDTPSQSSDVPSEDSAKQYIGSLR
jgi:hypothetical protein